MLHKHGNEQKFMRNCQMAASPQQDKLRISIRKNEIFLPFRNYCCKVYLNHGGFEAFWNCVSKLNKGSSNQSVYEEYIIKEENPGYD